MHTVLHLETDGLVAQKDESLKERLGETGSSGFLAHDSGSELRMISNNNQLLDSKGKRNHAFRFGLIWSSAEERQGQLIV